MSTYSGLNTELDSDLHQLHLHERTLVQLERLQSNEALSDVALESSMSLLLTSISLEAEGEGSVRDKLKSVIIKVIEAIRKYLRAIYKAITGSRNTIRLRRTQLQQGLSSLKAEFGAVVKENKGRLPGKREFIRNSYVVSSLNVEGDINSRSVQERYAGLLNLIRDTALATQRRIDTNTKILNTVPKVRSDVNAAKLLTPEPRPSICSRSINDSETIERLGANVHNEVSTSTPLLGNKALIHIALRPGVRQVQISSAGNTDLPAIPWWNNKHGTYLVVDNPKLDMTRRMNMGIPILTQIEMESFFEANEELLNTIASVESDVVSLENSLKNLDKLVENALRDVTSTADLIHALQSYLIGSIRMSATTTVAVYGYVLNIVQQTMSWTRSSLVLYKKGEE